MPQIEAASFLGSVILIGSIVYGHNKGAGLSTIRLTNAESNCNVFVYRRKKQMVGIFPLATMGGPLVAPVSSLLRAVPPPPLPR